MLATRYAVISGIVITVLEIELNGKLLEEIKCLAERHYGNASDVSIWAVVEVALQMRLLWANLVKGGGSKTEEPLARWEFPNTQQGDQLSAGIRDWLFKRG